MTLNNLGYSRDLEKISRNANTRGGGGVGSFRTNGSHRLLTFRGDEPVRRRKTVDVCGPTVQGFPGATEAVPRMAELESEQ